MATHSVKLVIHVSDEKERKPTVAYVERLASVVKVSLGPTIEYHHDISEYLQVSSNAILNGST